MCVCYSHAWNNKDRRLKVRKKCSQVRITHRRQIANTLLPIFVTYVCKLLAYSCDVFTHSYHSIYLHQLVPKHRACPWERTFPRPFLAPLLPLLPQRPLLRLILLLLPAETQHQAPHAPPPACLMRSSPLEEEMNEMFFAQFKTPYTWLSTVVHEWLQSWLACKLENSFFLVYKGRDDWKEEKALQPNSLDTHTVV